MTTTFEPGQDPFFIRVSNHPGIPLSDYHRVKLIQWESYETYCGYIFVDPRAMATTDNYDIAKPKLCGLCEYYYEREKEKHAAQEEEY